MQGKTSEYSSARKHFGARYIGEQSSISIIYILQSTRGDFYANECIKIIDTHGVIIDGFPSFPFATANNRNIRNQLLHTYFVLIIQFVWFFKYF